MRIVPLLIAALTAFPLAAQTNQIGVWAGRSHVGTTSLPGSDIHFDDGNAFGASYTHLFSENWAAEIAAFQLKHDGNIRVAGANAIDVGQLKLTPISAMLQWHAWGEKSFDPFFGFGIAYTHASDLHSADLTAAGLDSVKVKSRAGLTASVGASYAFVKPLAVAFEIRYIGYEPSSGPADQQVKLTLSPVLYSAGLLWRF